MFAVELKHCGPCGLDRPAHAFYFHDGKPWGKCKDCSREYAKQRQETHKQYARWREENPERHRETARKSASLWRTKNPEKWHRIGRKMVLKRNSRLEEKDYLAMFDSQGGKCALCSTTEPGGKKSKYAEKAHFKVDHCHKSEKIRGLLCNKCNTRLGMFEALVDAVGLENIQNYLIKSRS